MACEEVEASQTECPGSSEGITVADDDLPEEFESTPRIYGGVQLDDEEKAALALSPKYGLYRPLRVEQAKIDVEEALNKLRWNAIIKEGGNQGWGEVELVGLRWVREEVGRVVGEASRTMVTMMLMMILILIHQSLLIG